MRKSFGVAGIVLLLVGSPIGGTAYASSASDALGGDGYHGLKLGLSDQGALDTHQLGPLDSNDGSCDRYPTVDRPADGRSVAISHTYGLFVLRVPAPVRTPEGIGTGSTVAELKGAYPHAVSYRNGFAARVPGYTDRFYDVWVDANQEPYPDNARVIQLGLVSNSYDCVT